MYLAQNFKAEKIYASDLRKGPLESAKRTAAEFGVTDKLEFILTDGLTCTESCDYDTVVIAGMGGETIIAILEAAPWVLKEGINLILQPQSKISELLLWFESHSVLTQNAKLVEDEGRIYLVISAEVDNSVKYSNQYDFIPDKLIENRDPLLYKYLEDAETKLQKNIFGMKKSEREDTYLSIKKLESISETIKSIKQEAEKWQQ